MGNMLTWVTYEVFSTFAPIIPLTTIEKACMARIKKHRKGWGYDVCQLPLNNALMENLQPDFDRKAKKKRGGENSLTWP